MARASARGGGPSLLLLTGAPGIGKTTVMSRAAELLSFVPRGGFLTHELRTGGRRHGFRLYDFDGRDIALAHHNLKSARTVGRYGVDVAALDRFVGPALAIRAGARVYLVDEVGPMECLSTQFVGAMRVLIAKAQAPIVATVALRGGGYIAEVKASPHATLWEVTLQNRAELPDRVVEWVMGAR